MVARAGYYWPTLKQDCQNLVRHCDRCQHFAMMHRAPPEPLHSIVSPCPFYMWGAYILGPFPLAPGQMKFLIVGVDYFTKWVEAEPVATIFPERIKHFYWKNIICRFGLPIVIVTDNGMQFASSLVEAFCSNLGVKLIFNSVEHPQTNGLAEVANKVILNGLKKKLNDAKGRWTEMLCQVLWSYHTT